MGAREKAEGLSRQPPRGVHSPNNKERDQGTRQSSQTHLEGRAEGTSMTTVTHAKAESLWVLLAFAGRNVYSYSPPYPLPPHTDKSRDPILKCILRHPALGMRTEDGA